MTPVPITERVVSGIINLRGQTVTALDMREWLSLPSLAEAYGSDDLDQDDLPKSMNVVLRADKDIVSILVDRVGDVLTVEEALRDDVPTTVQPEVRCLLEDVYKLPNQLLLVLDTDRLVGQAA